MDYGVSLYNHGYPGYAVSADGDVFSAHKSSGKVRKLKHEVCRNGYHSVSLTYAPRKRRREMVHRLVAKVFLEIPDNKPYVNHRDANKSNNHFSNLEWCTHKENVDHAKKLKLYKGRTDKEKRNKMIKELSKKYTRLEIADAFGMSYENVGRILRS